MGIEQSLDEMLRSLKRSVDDLSEGEETVTDNAEDYTAISTSDLQKILEEKYFSEGAEGNHQSDGNYELDDDVLAQFYEENFEDETEGDEPEDDYSEFVEVEAEISDVDTAEDEAEISEVETVEVEAEMSDVETVEDALSETDAETTELDLLDAFFEPLEVRDESEHSEFIELFDELEEFDPTEAPDVLDELENLEFSEDADDYDEPAPDFTELDVIDTHTLIDPDVPDAEHIATAFSPEAYIEPIEPSSFDMELDTDGGAEDDAAIYEDLLASVVEDEGVADTEELEVEDDAEASENSEGEKMTEDGTDFDPYGAQTDDRAISFKALIRDYGKADPMPSASDVEEAAELEEDDYETPDVGDILSDFADDTPTRENKINSAVHKFMSSLGCEDELSEVSAEDIGAIYGQFGEKEDTEDEKRATAENIADRSAAYKKSKLASVLKLSACVFLTAVMFLYDILPLFEVDFIGLADYTAYPGAYVLIGTQLLLICAAVMWRELWDGIKGLLTVYPNIYSMAAVIVGACVFYDFVFFITGSYKPMETPSFHFLCGACLTVVCLYSLLMNIREAAIFDLYSADVAKFTLTRDKGANSVADKMYNGGFSKDKRVYTPSSVTEPKGFMDAIADKGGFYNVVFSSLILTAVGVAVIFGIVLLILGRTIEEGSIAAMTVFMAMMPISAVAAISIPTTVSYLKLKKRGIALTGRKMIRKYGAENAIVFSDLHLFSKCDPKRIGFECYEKLQTKNILASLNILYSRIGGPMGEAFSDIPYECRAKSIRIRRITQSGIEAVVDRSHVLLVGDIGFMRRYGIEFHMSKVGSDKDSIYVSLDGRASARLMTVYEVEPVFDMLIERLSAEGIHCVIETYDPMINTAFVSRHRRKGRSPISIVHKNAADINNIRSNGNRRSDHGLLVLSSRLKLAEALVWCARLCKIERAQNVAVCVSVGIGAVATAALGAVGLIPYFIQYLMPVYTLAVFAIIAVLTFNIIPQKTYFTVSALNEEDELREMNERKKNRNEQKHK